MSSSIIPVETSEQIAALAALATEIWNQHYVSIIGREQVDYMLDKFQSPEAIRHQIDNGYKYYLALSHMEPAGYIAVLPDEPPGKMMLSKLYVKASSRGAGLGTSLLEFTRNSAVAMGATALWLTVNRNNTHTIEWYKRKGFTAVDEVKMDIGSGFFMDDYVMEMGFG